MFAPCIGGPPYLYYCCPPWLPEGEGGSLYVPLTCDCTELAMPPNTLVIFEKPLLSIEPTADPILSPPLVFLRIASL